MRAGLPGASPSLPSPAAAPAVDLRSDRPCVLVTRPQPQADAWVASLQALGLPAGALPLLGIADAADPAPVQRAWRQLVPAGGAAPDIGPALAAAMFVSPSAVERFFALRPAGAAWPPAVIAAGTGPGTRRALLQAGVPASALLTPSESAGQFDSEALWALLQPLDWAGRSVLVVRGEGGRDWLATAWRGRGAAVHFVEAYRRTVPVPDAAGRALLRRALDAPAAHCWLFSSSEAVGHLPALVAAADGAAPAPDWSACCALATHPRIAEAALRLGFGRVQVVGPSPAAVAAALGAPGSVDTIPAT